MNEVRKLKLTVKILLGIMLAASTINWVASSRAQNRAELAKARFEQELKAGIQHGVEKAILELKLKCTPANVK